MSFMHTIQHAMDSATRRDFLRRMVHLGSLGVAAPTALSLAAMGEASANTGTDDYRALVCLYLSGGVDQGNLLVPYDEPNHALYRTVRTNLAIARTDLAATALTQTNDFPALANGMQLAMHPGLASLKPVFDAGHLAAVLNVGPLAVPTTATQYTNKSVPLPRQLFSHHDQTNIWHSADPSGKSILGWGGKISDVLLASQASQFISISASGQSIFMNGAQCKPCNIHGGGPVLNQATRSPFVSGQVGSMVRQVMANAGDHVMQQVYADTVKRSLELETALSSAFNARTIATPFPNHPWGTQLRTIARFIAGRGQLGNPKRQVFFLELPGWDHHNNLLINHNSMLRSLALAMAAFNDALKEIGAHNQVTTFTTSEFGRTLVSNNFGSDHGWGGHHLVMGGNVRGGGFHGTMPVPAASGPDYAGEGRLIPKLSLDQYGAALAKSMGVTNSSMGTIFPNLSRFDANALNLFRTA